MDVAPLWIAVVVDYTIWQQFAACCCCFMHAWQGSCTCWSHCITVCVSAVLRLPTLYISECVLIYLEPGEAQQVLAAAAARARAAGSSAAVVIYEQTRPDDAFGSTMISNLEVSCCSSRSKTSIGHAEVGHSHAS